MKNNKKGFTLIELLVVIAIIGLLSTLAVVSLNSARQKARDARRMSDLKQISTAMELYYSQHDAYPATGVCNAAGVIAVAVMVQFALLEMQLLMEQMFSLIQYRTLQVEQELRHYICMAEQVLPLRIV